MAVVPPLSCILNAYSLVGMSKSFTFPWANRLAKSGFEWFFAPGNLRM